jgi:glycerol-3-phosphate cytidylyltransferase-like family protein
VTTLFKARKEKKKKMMMKDEKNRLKFVQKFCDQRKLLQQIVLHQSFNDRFEFFARVRHDVIIVDVDVFKTIDFDHSLTNRTL